MSELYIAFALPSVTFYFGFEKKIVTKEKLL